MTRFRISLAILLVLLGISIGSMTARPVFWKCRFRGSPEGF